MLSQDHTCTTNCNVKDLAKIVSIRGKWCKRSFEIERIWLKTRAVHVNCSFFFHLDTFFFIIVRSFRFVCDDGDDDVIQGYCVSHSMPLTYAHLNWYLDRFVFISLARAFWFAREWIFVETLERQQQQCRWRRRRRCLFIQRINFGLLFIWQELMRIGFRLAFTVCVRLHFSVSVWYFLIWTFSIR